MAVHRLVHGQLPARTGAPVTRALLVSLSAPEMDRLAVELAGRGALTGLVRRYANKHRGWERTLASLPLFGGVYTSTLGRRLPPPGLDNKLVIEAGIATDFLAAVVNRAGRSVPDLTMRFSRPLLTSTEMSIARTGGSHVPRADVVVASYHVAEPAFTKARALGRRTVLNYPIAHHRWQYRFFESRARQHPEFAAALPNFGDTAAHGAALDREIGLADVILVGSSFVRDTFVSEGVAPEKLRVIPYGADSQRFTPPGQPRSDGIFRALFVGQIGERKGISHLLQAYRAFQKPDTELHLVGDYVQGSEVYRPYRDLYRHTPNVPQTDLAAIFRTADVFVFPTLVEGMPMVVLEAMASGLPVVATPNGPGDVVRDGIDGFIVPPGDTDAIVARLEQLHADRDLLQRMGNNARQRAGQWSWGRYARDAANAVLQS